MYYINYIRYSTVNNYTECSLKTNYVSLDLLLHLLSTNTKVYLMVKCNKYNFKNEASNEGTIYETRTRKEEGNGSPSFSQEK